MPLKFSFAIKKTKTATSILCHFQFGEKPLINCSPLGHEQQWAMLCQLSLKTVRINGPKISFKITIFCTLVAGCQLSSTTEISDLSLQLIFNLVLTPGFLGPLACANNKTHFAVIQLNKELPLLVGGKRGKVRWYTLIVNLKTH